MSLDAAELFTGCGGLALGLERAGFRHRFFCESDEPCRDVLRRRFPGVPIVEDVRDVGASSPADAANEGSPRAGRGREPKGGPSLVSDSGSETRLSLLAGGFPCQPFSAAGRRKGDKDDRYLWPEFARAIRVLRPRAVLLENVPGILSLALDSGEPVFGRVLADLAEAGYVGSWFCLRASDIGAPHRRERVFVVAHAANLGHDGSRRAWNGRQGLANDGGDPPDPQGDTRRLGDGDGGVAADPAERGCGGWPHRHGANGDERQEAERSKSNGQPAGGADVQAWGIYEPAIRRWERLTRPAPRPTDDRGRLDPRFPEWMLGFPEGWVEDVSRTAQLRMLGNVVQVQVAELVGSLVRDRLTQDAATAAATTERTS